MRSSRLKRSRKQRIKGFIRLVSISIIPLSAAFCLSLITTPSYALMRSEVRVAPSQFSAAFVFPNTVQDMANKVKSNCDSALDQAQGLQVLLKVLPTVNNQKRSVLIMQMQQLSAKTQALLDESVNLYSNLEQFSIKAQTDMDNVQNLYTELKKKPWVNQNQLIEVQSNLKSVQKVNTYVQSAYIEAKSAINMLYQLNAAPLFTSNGLNLQSTVSHSVYGLNVTEDVYSTKPTVTSKVYQVNVTDAVYKKQTVSHSVYETSISAYQTSISQSVYNSQTVTRRTYGMQDTPTYILNEAKLEKIPLSQSNSVPQNPPVSTPDKILDNISSSGRTNRKTVDSNGITVTLVPKD